MSNIVIIGGHGKLALRLTRILAREKHTITSIVVDAAQEAEVKESGATPKTLALADEPASRFTALFESTKADVVYLIAPLTGPPGTDSGIEKIDHEVSLKIFDAIEAVTATPKPFLILFSGIDVRHLEKAPPAHYTEVDIEKSKGIHSYVGEWMKVHYKTDLNLLNRGDKFKWFIIRPGGFTDEPATGKVAIGQVHLDAMISRDDLAEVMALLVKKQNAAGLALDIVGGTVPYEEALDTAIAKGETDFHP